MPERTSYRPGTPCWIDLGSPDPAGAATFYSSLFGWQVEVSPLPDAGGYAMCNLRDLPVAGLGSQMNPDMPPFWSVYVSVTDADATLALAQANGATVIVPSMDVFSFGRMGIFLDPQGSPISVWQPNEHIGAQVVNETGTFAWNELSSNDVAASKAFYTAVFGWGTDAEHDTDEAVVFTVEGEVVCGAHKAQQGEPPFWSVWFAVDDCDASAAQVSQLGGSVIVPPNDMGFGRGSVVVDPYGAAFGIGAMAPPAE